MSRRASKARKPPPLPHTFGRVPRHVLQDHPGNVAYPLRAGLRALGVVEEVPAARTWYLRHADQVDQGQTPMCVEATTRHWEMSAPVRTHRREPFGFLYGMAKKIDGYPGEDGTDAHAMFQVLQGLGEIGSYWWYDGHDRDAARLWVRVRSPLFLGCYVSDQMCYDGTEADGRWRVTGALEYGHEMCVLGWNPRRRGREWLGVQSWGRDAFGRDGRFYLSEDDFWALVENQGDLGGAIQTRAPRTPAPTV